MFLVASEGCILWSSSLCRHFYSFYCRNIKLWCYFWKCICFRRR